MNIKGKCALVTGGASGIGLTCVLELLRHGAKRVVIIDLNNVTGMEAKEKLKKFGEDRSVFLCCDVTNAEEFSDVFKKANEICDGLDIVVNNAGILDEKRWELMIDINYKAVVRGTLLAIDYMGRQKGGNGGTVLNVASITGLSPITSIPIYSGTKHAVVGFSNGVQAFYDVTGVRVLTLCPGVTRTNLPNELEGKIHDFIGLERTKNMMGSLPVQETNVVADAIMKMIQDGKNGDNWVVEGGEPPYAVQMQHYSTSK